MCTVSCPAADSRSMPIGGSHASRGSSSRYGYCRGCSGGASSKNCRSCIVTGNSSSSASTSICPTPLPSPMPLRQCEWVVYAKRPFAGPEAVLAYLSRYTHRVAISNSRLIAHDDRGVPFRWKDYREHGRTLYKTMTLASQEFIRRFLLHVLPPAFHRFRPSGLLANARRKTHIATARELLHQPAPRPSTDGGADHGCTRPTFVCRHCGAPMLVIQIFARAQQIRAPPTPPISP